MDNQRVEMDPDVMGGKPVIRGTRIPVELVLHPRLTPEDIQAAQAFAADYLAEGD